MKYLLIFFLILSSAIHTSAQTNKREQLEAAKIAFITQQLDLNPEQAEKFWPLFNEFSGKRKELRVAHRKLRMEVKTDDATEEQLKANINKMFELKQQELSLEKEYYNRFLKVLSAKQVVELVKAEREFIAQLYKKLAED